jgi:uncharacterized membrane protein (UPF0127 family)
MRKWILLLCVAAALVLLFVICSDREESPHRQSPVVIFPGGTIVVEIADSEAERRSGLSGRAGLASGRGMLFLHEDSAVQSYWMKGMSFAIDIIWIDDDEIVGFVEEAQPEDPPETVYVSPGPVDKVLEVPAGFVALHALEIGAILDIELSNQ